MIFEPSSGHEQVLRRGNASRDQLRWAGYDLRAAADRVRVNGCDLGTADEPVLAVTLKPGDVASLTSFEQFCMPWDVAANIGPRFHLARRGLLIFTGLLVDPGFGLEPGTDSGKSAWVPKADERLEFFVANLAADPIEIRLGEKGDSVLSLQFFRLNAITEPGTEGYKKSSDARLSPTALSLIRDVRELQRDLKTEQGARMEAIGRLDKSDQRE